MCLKKLDPLEACQVMRLIEVLVEDGSEKYSLDLSKLTVPFYTEIDVCYSCSGNGMEICRTHTGCLVQPCERR